MLPWARGGEPQSRGIHRWNCPVQEAYISRLSQHDQIVTCYETQPYLPAADDRVRITSSASLTLYSLLASGSLTDVCVWANFRNSFCSSPHLLFWSLHSHTSVFLCLVAFVLFLISCTNSVLPIAVNSSHSLWLFITLLGWILMINSFYNRHHQVDHSLSSCDNITGDFPILT